MSKRAPHDPNWKEKQRGWERQARMGLVHKAESKTLAFTDRQMVRAEDGSLRRNGPILRAGDDLGHDRGPDRPAVQGIPFFSITRNQHMVLVQTGPYANWLVYQHPDGQWVTLRRATDRDRAELAKAAELGY
jgi:hypothetical protein